ncbi:G2/mitotic-specific cyclin-4 [Frankliniella fusca]|uniref:G2/mitotic-specific cyclin-4 n=1 Tax=Frankliniella fusca TaxID=407009 RepID=A0AAE1HT29_9NEOP|nr:G2/mitotic-specific cyclin-4 [Frankliniella fusca]
MLSCESPCSSAASAPSSTMPQTTSAFSSYMLTFKNPSSSEAPAPSSSSSLPQTTTSTCSFKRPASPKSVKKGEDKKGTSLKPVIVLPQKKKPGSCEEGSRRSSRLQSKVAPAKGKKEKVQKIKDGLREKSIAFFSNKANVDVLELQSDEEVSEGSGGSRNADEDLDSMDSEEESSENNEVRGLSLEAERSLGILQEWQSRPDGSLNSFEADMLISNSNVLPYENISFPSRFEPDNIYHETNMNMTNGRELFIPRDNEN